MFRTKYLRAIALSTALVLTAAACSDDDDDTTTDTTEAPASDGTTDGEAVDSSTICDTDGLVEAVESGPEEGTLDGMTDDPVGTAASSNPVLTTLVTAVTEADLVSTLDGAEALTVFAPTDCAFAEMDPATLQAALDDPSGLLTEVLGFHVIAERLEPGDLETGDLTTFTGATLPIEVDGDTITLNDGQSTVLVPGIQTANATVYLIDTVMLPG
jgi:transforming growth factor-beta-induced protein